MNTYPTYELTIDGTESFVDAIALVENPAIEKEFLAFTDTTPIKFSVDDDKMELLGAAMVPNQLIYRRNDDGFEYQVYFSKDTIRQISQSFFKGGFHTNMNIEHSATTADSYVFQSIIVDSSKGISVNDLPDGTWVVGVKVLNADVWKAIKSGKHKGFSVEGIFELIKRKFNTIKTDEDEVLELLKHIQNKISNHI